MSSDYFDPRGKTFSFRLDEYSCYRCKTGTCSLDNISLDELKANFELGKPGKINDLNYCRGIAGLFLHNMFKVPANILLHSKCGHYSFSDGQHRTCVVGRILQKGGVVTLNFELAEGGDICRSCYFKIRLNQLDSQITIIDKIFKTKLYKERLNLLEKSMKREFLYHLDK